jgi:anti-sigma-K factor RskA
MNCQERREQFLLDAVGALAPAEATELHAHLATGCVECAGAAAEAETVAASLARQIAPVEPSPAVLEQLMKRVGKSVAQQSTSLPARKPQIAHPEPELRGVNWFSTLGFSAIAALLAAAITAGVMWSQLPAEKLLKTQDLRYVSLAGSDPQPKARGRIFWDADHGYWHVYVFDMAPPASGKTYELWFIGNDGRKTRAGLFDVNAKGDANLVVKVPGDLGPLAAAAVTDESAGGSEQPTGTIQLLGKIQ